MNITITFQPVVKPITVTVSRADYELMGAEHIAKLAAKEAEFDGELEVDGVELVEAQCNECSSSRPGSCLCASALSDDADARELDNLSRARAAA